jgi:hypothetical protein
MTSSLLEDQRYFARGAWGRRAWERPGRMRNHWCLCGHTKLFHGLYHPRRDGEWEECWPIHESPCKDALTFCEVCEDCADFERVAAPALV